MERALTDYPELQGQVGLREKTEILRRVAYSMQSVPRGLPGNFIDGATLTAEIIDYLRVELQFAQANGAANAVVRQLRERNVVLCFLGGDSYGFVHRTFLEFFCASEFVHRFNVAKTLGIADLTAIFETHCGDDEWREVLRLICGQIDERFVNEIASHLLSRIDVTPQGLFDSTFVSIPEIVLVVQCLAELRNLTRLKPA